MIPPSLSLDEFIDRCLPDLVDRSVHGFTIEDGRNIARTAFYASMEPEEGRLSSFSLALVDEWLLEKQDRGYSWRPLVLRDPVDLSVANVAKIASASNRRYSCIAVRRTGDGLRIAGLIRRNSSEFRFSRGAAKSAGGISDRFLVVTATGPGQIEVRVNSGLIGTFHRGNAVPEGVRLFAGGWLFDELSDSADAAGLDLVSYHDMVRAIVRNLSERQLGGTILLLPTADTTDLAIRYAISDGACAIQDALRFAAGDDLGPRGETFIPLPGEPPNSPRIQEMLRTRRVIEAMEFLRDGASFAADLGGIDGAVVLERSLAVVGFGCKITSAEPVDVPARLALSADGTNWSESPLGSLGTRHNSAARYCFGHPRTIGFVASQDGILSCMYRASESEDLLIWRPVTLNLARVYRPRPAA